MTTTKNGLNALPKTSLFLLVAVTLGACAAELEGKPEDFEKAYQTPSGAGSASMAGASGRGGGSGGSPSASGGSPSTSGGSPSGSAGSPSGSAGSKGGGVIPADPACLSAVLPMCTGCHSASFKLGGFDISGSNLGQRFSTQKATYMNVVDNADKCKPGALIIDPENPSESILLKKVLGTQDCGTVMPQTGKLQGANLKCFEDWINAFGASANVSSFDQASGSGGENR